MRREAETEAKLRRDIVEVKECKREAALKDQKVAEIQ